MKRSVRLFAILLVMLAWTVAIAGCGVPSGPAAEEPPATTTPPPAATVTPEPSVPESPTPEPPRREIAVYLIRGEKVQPVVREVPVGTTAVLRAALEALTAGPTTAEKQAGLSTQIPRGTKLRDVSLKGGFATIDLTTEYDSGGGSATMFARLAQVVFTATQFDTVEEVVFRIDGRTVQVFSAEGIELDGPQSRRDYEDQSPAILVETPAWGGTLTGTIRGTSNVFEANHRLQVRDSSGKLVVDRAVQATSGTGTRGTWRVTVPMGRLRAGAARIRVFEESAKDGKPVNVIDVPVVVR